eukprot:TRINITY_DN4194_c0_g1_i1.p1 TRINITY_DN4194_c0_g1~~TRINITY_DN4194_c0_g1_i1.p1  ORF type:complete len:230 (+),score=44.42 TRINITY_DN4194_c0_g1_i1:189-878(+)
MVIPLGADLGPDVPVPEDIKVYHAKYWWAMMVLFLALAVSHIVGADVFGTIFMCVMAGTCFWVVKDNCKNMTQYCLFLICFMCTFQALLEFIALLSVLNGRKQASTVMQRTDDGKITYTTTVVSHPFFDEKMGTRYNVQSWNMIFNPIILLLAALLAYHSFNTYTTSLFEEDQEAGYNSGFGGGYSQPGYGGVGAAGGGYGAGRNSQQQRPAAAAPPRLFAGTGQRLGS